jgi:hypothetical protein
MGADERSHTRLVQPFASNRPPASVAKRPTMATRVFFSQSSPYDALLGSTAMRN